MTHLTPAEIVALRDGETAALAEDRRRHADGCGPCREAVDAARFRARRVAASLPRIPVAEERVEAARASVQARLEAAGALSPSVAPSVAPSGAASGRSEERGAWRPLSRPSASSWGSAWSLGRAAALLLLLAGGAAALPGSPVRSWIEAALEDPPAATETATPELPEAAGAPAPAETGVRLRVEEGPVEVRLEGAAPGTRVVVTRGDGAELEVFAPDGSRFRSSDGRVEVRATGGPVRVRLPADVVPATLRVGTRVYLLWTADGPEIRGPVVERDDERIVFEVEG